MPLPPPPPPSPRDRQPLLAQKQQLAAQLGEHAAEYWETLRSFLTGKISKLELDLIVRELLPARAGTRTAAKGARARGRRARGREGEGREGAT